MTSRSFRAAIAAILTIACGTAAAQEKQVPLPQVDVTAPGITNEPPLATSDYSTHTRVEENKWPEIPCSGARIASVAGGTCQNGNPTETKETMSNVDHRCDIAHQLSTFNDGRHEVEADVLIFDPYKVIASQATGHQSKYCTIWPYKVVPQEYYDMNQVTRRATNWGTLVEGDPVSTISFTDRGRGCLAVQKFGPPWHGGRIWIVHATICPMAPAPLQAADIDAVFSQIRINIYDPNGNLRAPDSVH